MCSTLKDLESIVSELGPKSFFLDLELPEGSSTDYRQYEARSNMWPLQNGPNNVDGHVYKITDLDKTYFNRLTELWL